MNTLKFCGKNMSPEMQNLVKKVKAEFTNVDIQVTDDAEKPGLYDQRYTAVANGTTVTGDTTHALFERIKNVIGEREVGE